MKRNISALWVLLSCWVSTAAMATTVEDINSFTLDNGMKIMVLEDSSIPNANMYLFWKVGSRNEAPGITGISHFFEHMMFNGSKKYGPKMFDRTMEAAGGANNAYTTEDTTVYTNWFPANALETIFDLEADRIANLDINSQMVESERGVVQSERTTGLENSNWRTLQQEVKGAAFRAHPYSWPVIGHESDIAAWSLADLQQYHKTYYAPNNAVVVIAGDVKTAEVKRLAKQYFGVIAAQPAPLAVRTVEPLQKGERRVFVEKASVTTPNVLLAYHVPSTKHADYYALDILSTIFSEGNSSRLYQGLVDKQLASDVMSYLPMSFDPNLFYFLGVANAGIDALQLEASMIAEINRIALEGVSEQELEKVKNIKLMDFYRTMQTINGRANTLGRYELYFGSYDKLFSAPAAYNKVTVADIQRVAQTYLRKANRTVGVLAATEGAD
ncbi:MULTISPECIES: pitrilysin family protein [unclassified Shewanella]|uniref:M16 family metallopeptidase n=1 Tax=unclassified Shewanella TaxID=196818 RepID=UPI000C81C918|nr:MULTISPECIES: pitrilysin family protein [unclassified Shewanella]MDO6618432.1 pitrilysin family protein [Shewanella sp. 6_MG-2023]MDO6640255.1 pitrilysin family protein [Shewanella sp. 5_MG-2023]MDO6679667.1 pitrilysin family protein [Shewanella sp. 4_MG-2023]MDO6774434.1 pitrilysin family protein [Shewanella sp. 3_MG-2023]PMG28904.1 peptidase M16 [Shewanella sp. 10N.286.52.C2]